VWNRGGSVKIGRTHVITESKSRNEVTDRELLHILLIMKGRRPASNEGVSRSMKAAPSPGPPNVVVAWTGGLRKGESGLFQ